MYGYSTSGSSSSYAEREMPGPSSQPISRPVSRKKAAKAAYDRIKKHIENWEVLDQYDPLLAVLKELDNAEKFIDDAKNALEYFCLDKDNIINYTKKSIALTQSIEITKKLQNGLRIPADEKAEPSLNALLDALSKEPNYRFPKNYKIILDTASQALDVPQLEKFLAKGIGHFELNGDINPHTLSALRVIQNIDEAKRTRQEAFVEVISVTAVPSSSATEFFNWLFNTFNKRKLQKLHLNIPLSASHFAQLIEFITDNNNLKILDISDNQIPENQVSAFINAMQNKIIIIIHNDNFPLDERIKNIVDKNARLKNDLDSSANFGKLVLDYICHQDLLAFKKLWGDLRQFEDEKFDIREEKACYYQNIFAWLAKVKENQMIWFDLVSINQLLMEIFTYEKAATPPNRELLEEIAYQSANMFHIETPFDKLYIKAVDIKGAMSCSLKQQASYIDKSMIEFYPYTRKAANVKIALFNEAEIYFNKLIGLIKQKVEELEPPETYVADMVATYAELLKVDWEQEVTLPLELNNIINEYLKKDIALRGFLMELRQIMRGFVERSMESTKEPLRKNTYKIICKIVDDIQKTTPARTIIDLCDEIRFERTGIPIIKTMLQQKDVKFLAVGKMIVALCNNVILELSHPNNNFQDEVRKVTGIPHPLFLWYRYDDNSEYFRNLFSNETFSNNIIPAYNDQSKKNLELWMAPKEDDFTEIFCRHKEMFDFVKQLQQYTFFQELCSQTLKKYLAEKGLLEQLILKANREGRFLEIKEHLAAVQTVCLNIPELSSNFCHCIFRVAKFDAQMQKATTPLAIDFEGESKGESKDEMNPNRLDELESQFDKLETLLLIATNNYELKLNHAEVANKIDELIMMAECCVSLAESKADIKEKLAHYEKAISLFVKSNLPIELSRQLAIEHLDFAFNSLEPQGASIVKNYIDLVLKQKKIKPEFFDKKVLEVVYSKQIEIEKFSEEVTQAQKVLYEEINPVDIQKLQNLIILAKICQEKLNIIKQYFLETADEPTLDCRKQLAQNQKEFQQLIEALFDKAVNAASKLQDIPNISSLEQYVENLLKIYEKNQEHFIATNTSREEELLDLANANLPYSAVRQTLLLPILKNLLFKKIALLQGISIPYLMQDTFIQEVNVAQTMDGFNTILNRHASFWNSSPSRQECYRLINYHVYKKILNPGLTRNAVLLEKTRQQKQQETAKMMEIPTTFVFSLINVFIANPLTKNILYASFKYPLFLLTTLVELFWFKTIFNSYPDSKSKANTIELVIGWIKLPLILASILSFASDFLGKGILNLINLGEKWWGHTSNLGSYSESLDWFSNTMGGMTAGSFIGSVLALSFIKDMVIAIYHLVMSYRAYTPKERNAHWQQCKVKVKLSVMMSLITVSMMLGNGLSFFGYTLFEPVMTTIVVGAMSLSITMFLCALGSFAMGVNAVWNNTQKKPLWQRIGWGMLLGALNTTLTLVLGPIVGGTLLSLLSGPLLPVILVSIAALAVINAAFPQFFSACVEKLHLSKQTILAGIMLLVMLCTVFSWPTLVIVLPVMAIMLAIHVKYPTLFADLAKTIVANVLSLIGNKSGEKQVVQAPSAISAIAPHSSNSREDDQSTQRIASPISATQCSALMFSSSSTVNPVQMPPETKTSTGNAEVQVSSAASMSLVCQN